MVEWDQTDLMVTVPGMDPMAVEGEVEEETEEATEEVTEETEELGVMEEVEEMVVGVVEVVWVE